MSSLMKTLTDGSLGGSAASPSSRALKISALRFARSDDRTPLFSRTSVNAVIASTSVKSFH